MATEVLRIIVDQRGANTAAAGITRVGAAARSSSTAVQTLRNLLLTLGVGIGIRGLTNTVDSFIQIENRVRLATKTQEEFNDAQQQLFDVAQETRQPLDATAELFRRLRVNTEDLGFSQERVIGLIRTINQSIAVSGATAQEARNGIIQLAQGFASGELRGEEFRAVAEQLPGLLLAIADGTGKTVGELRELAFSGQLTPEIVANAIESQSERIAASFALITPTVEQAGIIIDNAFTRFLGTLDQTLGASAAFTDVARAIAENIDTLAIGFVSAVTAILGYVSAIRLARVATVGFRKALTRTGIGALVVGFGLLVNELITFGLRTEKVSGVTVTGFDRIKVAVEAAFNTLRIIATSVIGTVGGLFNSLSPILIGAFTGFGQAARNEFNAILADLNQLGQATLNELNTVIAFFASLPEALQIATEAGFTNLGLILGVRFTNALIDFVADNVNRFLQGITDTLNRLPGVDLADPIQIPPQRISEPIIEGAQDALTQIQGIFNRNRARDFVGEFVNEAQRLIGTVSSTFNQEQQAAFDRLLARLRAAAAEEERLRKAIEDAQGDPTDPFGNAADKEVERLASRITDRFTDALVAAFQGESVDFAEQFIDSFAALLKNSLEDVFEELVAVGKQLIDDLTKRLAKSLGTEQGNIANALGAAVGVGGLLLTSALRDSQNEVTNNFVESAVTNTQATRGVVVGPTEIPIFQVGNALEDALGVTNGILRDILTAILQTGAAGAASTLDQEAASVLSQNGPTLV